MESELNEEYLDEAMLQALGVSPAAYDEVISILGHRPTTEQMNTLLAMWQSNGSEHSLLAFLRGQPHTDNQHDNYIYAGSDSTHKQVREPRVAECAPFANSIIRQLSASPMAYQPQHGDLLYMIGNVSSLFLDSEYAHRYLRIASPTESDARQASDFDTDYAAMILRALHASNIIHDFAPVGQFGIFGTLAACCHPAGFDILTCREVRLDAFLFGEEAGRFIAVLSEETDDTLLQKLFDARLACCFLGRVTHGRILVDGSVIY